MNYQHTMVSPAVADLARRSGRSVLVTVVMLAGAVGGSRNALAELINVTPASFGSGQIVMVTGTGFAPGATINVWFDGNNNAVQDASEPSDVATADASGAFFGASVVVKGAQGDYFVRAGTPAAVALAGVHIDSCLFNDECAINGAQTLCLFGNSPSDPLSDCKALDSSYGDASDGFNLNNGGPRFAGAGVLAAAVNDLGIPGTGCVAMTAAIAFARAAGNDVPGEFNFADPTKGLMNIACGPPFGPLPFTVGFDLPTYIAAQALAGHGGDPAMQDASIILGAVVAAVTAGGGPGAPPVIAAQQLVASAAVSGAIACGHVSYFCNGLDITFNLMLQNQLQAKPIPLPIPGFFGKRWGDIIGWAIPTCFDNTLPAKDAAGNYVLPGTCEETGHARAVPGSAGPNNVLASNECATGTVTGMSIGYDGDISFDINDGPTHGPAEIDPATGEPYRPGTLIDPLSPGPGIAQYTNYHNFMPGPGGSDPPGGIDIEIPRFDMARFMPQIIAMRTGLRVRVCGQWVADMHQLWNEFHPVTSIVILGDSAQTPPAVTPMVDGMRGANDWYTGDVTVSWDLSNSHPAVTSSSGCDPTTITADTPGQTLTCTATSDDGTTTQSITIKRDATPPLIGHVVIPPVDGSNGWHVSAPTVTFSCSDTGSGLESCLANGDSSGSVTLGENANVQTVTGTATDNAGNVSQDLVSLRVDLSNPTISAAADRPANPIGWYAAPVQVSFTCADTVSGVATCPAAVILGEGTNQSASGTVTDTSGRSASTTLSGINIDMTPPVVICPGGGVTECQSLGGSFVSLALASATDVGQGTAVITNSYTAGGDDASGSYPLGSTQVTFTATDGAGNSSSCNTVVTVADTTPPTVRVDSAPNYLWPPNHKKYGVHTNVAVVDTCDPAPRLVLDSIVSSEPDNAPGGGDGNTTGDIEGALLGTADFDFLLRAEREGNGPGRTYTIRYRATDASANHDVGTDTVKVPHDQNGIDEPISLKVDDALSTLVRWEPAYQAQHFDVIRGNLEQIRVDGSNFELGAVICLKTNATTDSAVGSEDAVVPQPGKAFFYLVQFYDGAKESSYGERSAAKARVMGAGSQGCH